MANEQTVFTDRGSVWLSKLYATSNTVLLGLGRTSPWVAEDAPPEPESFEYQLPELFAYIPVVLHRGLVSDPAGTIVLADGSKWTKIEVEEGEDLEEAIVIANAHSVLIEAVIPHSDLPVDIDNYRAYGIYVGCEILEEHLDSTVIPVDGAVVGPLEYICHFSPVDRQGGFTHNIQLIRHF